MLTKTVLDRLSTGATAKTDNDPPRIKIGNLLPSGYTIVTAGAGFWYRKNQNQDPETTLEEDLSIERGDSVTLRGSRRDCCRLAQIFVDVQTPSGDILFGSKTLEPPSGQCIIQEAIVLEPTTFASGTTIDLKFES